MSIKRTIVELLSTVLLSCLPVASQTQTGTGKVTGLVTGADGKPVSNVEVSINVRPGALTDPFVPYNVVVVTGTDGTFAATGVPKGKFAVCPRAPAGLLAPCTWGNEILTSVSDGQLVTMPSIQLQAGADLYLRVNDLKGKLASAQGKVPGASLMLAVRSPNGMMVPIPMTASDKTGFDHHLTVPHNTDMLLAAFSSTFPLANAVGVAADPQKGINLSISIPASQAQHRETIQIP